MAAGGDHQHRGTYCNGLVHPADDLTEGNEFETRDLVWGRR